MATARGGVAGGPGDLGALELGDGAPVRRAQGVGERIDLRERLAGAAEGGAISARPQRAPEREPRVDLAAAGPAAPRDLDRLLGRAERTLQIARDDASLGQGGEEPRLALAGRAAFTAERDAPLRDLERLA